MLRPSLGAYRDSSLGTMVMYQIGVQQVSMSIRKRVFEHMLLMPLHKIQQLKSGGATSLIREDAGGIAELIFSMVYNPCRQLFN